MSNYVEEGYSQGYTEGDTPSTSVSCDLSPLVTLIETQNTEISTLKTMLLSLTDSVSFIKNKLVENESMAISIKTVVVENRDTLVVINDNVLVNASAIANMPDIGSLPTMDYIDTKIPFVDDMSVKVFPNGTQVSVAGFDKPCIVVSSSFLPYEEHTYIVIYVVSNVDSGGVTKLSNFSSNQVILYVAPEVP